MGQALQIAGVFVCVCCDVCYTQVCVRSEFGTAFLVCRAVCVPEAASVERMLINEKLSASEREIQRNTPPNNHRISHPRCSQI